MLNPDLPELFTIVPRNINGDFGAARKLGRGIKVWTAEDWFCYAMLFVQT